MEIVFLLILSSKKAIVYNAYTSKYIYYIKYTIHTSKTFVADFFL